MVAKRRLGPDIVEFVRSRGWALIAGCEWEELRVRFAGTSEKTLRKHLNASGVAVAQPWRGVDTSTLDALEQSLIEIAETYRSEAKESRRIVIAAKDTTRFAARNPKVAAEKRGLKAEMVDWMLVWLGDPAMFTDWVKLRKRYLVEGNRLDL